MNLAIHYHIPCQMINGEIYTMGQQGVFIDALSPFFDKILCFMHEPNEKEKHLLDYRIKSGNIDLINIGEHYNLLKRLLRVRKYLRIISEYENEFDVILMRTPSPLSNFILRKFKSKCAVYVVGDYVDAYSAMNFSRLKMAIMFLWVNYYEKHQNSLVKHALCMTNSAFKKLKLEKYNPNVKMIKSTTLNADSFYRRIDTCENEIVKVLYTGRIDPSKGLDEILSAVIKLNEKGLKVELNLAGMLMDGNMGYVEKLKNRAKEKGFPDKIQWHGLLKLGEELDSLYRSCDIYCLASQSNFEGFPRTIWEAMANSLPVIATKVGSIPLFLNHKNTAYLVDPRNIPQLQEALLAIINEKNLRKDMIKNAFELAKDNTLENFGIKMSREIIKHFS